MRSEHLLATALKLTRGRSKPRQADLCRAMSTIYYALFHELARTSADLLIGTPGPHRSDSAWYQIYRALEHGTVVRACTTAHFKTSNFPSHVKDFAQEFEDAQRRRHEADYNPLHRTTKSEVIFAVAMAKTVIGKFRGCKPKDKRAFCAYVIIKRR